MVIFITEVYVYYLLFKEKCFYAFNINTHVHSIDSLRFYNQVYLKIPIQDIIRQFFSPGYWPRLHYAFTALFISLFGRNYMSMAMVNLLYLLILMISVYGITIEVTKDRWCALLSAFVISVNPGIVQFMKIFELQMGVIAFTSLSIYFLILSNYFKKTIYTILFAIFVCFSMYMDRATPIVFVIGPVIYILYKVMKEIRNKNFDKKFFLNIVLVSLIISIILKPFYFAWVKNVLLNKTRFFTMCSTWAGYDGTKIWKELINFGSPFFFKRSFFYITIFPNWLLGIFWSIIFLCSMPLFLKNKCQYSYIFLWWLIFPIIFFTIIPKKDFSYIIPILSPIAIIISIGFYSFKNRLLRIYSLAIILLFGIAQFIIFAFYLDVHAIPKLALRKLFTNINMARKDPVIFEIFYPNFPDKDVYQWISDDIVKFFPSDEKFKITMVSQREMPGWYEYYFGVVMLLYNPRAIVSLFFTPSDCLEFNCSDSDYVAFIKMKNSQKSLDSEMKDQLNFYNIIDLDKLKINLQDYTLVYKKPHPILPVEVEIYRKSSLE